MSEGVYNSGTDAKPGERAGAGHKFYGGDIVPGFIIFGEFVVDEFDELLGEVVGK